MNIMNFIVYGCGILLLSSFTTGQTRSTNECTTSEWFGCLLSPCYFASCSLYPEAICSVETKSCGGCRAVWTVAGQVVDCEKRPRCPFGVVEMTNCANNLCRDPFCPDYPRATCVPDICGHCEEDYYQDGIRVDCIGSFRQQLRQLRLLMRGESTTNNNGIPNEPVPIVLTNNPTNIDPVVDVQTQGQVQPIVDLTGTNSGFQNDMVGNINEVAQISLSSQGGNGPDMPPNNPIENFPSLPANSPVVGSLDTSARPAMENPVGIQSQTQNNQQTGSIGFGTETPTPPDVVPVQGAVQPISQINPIPSGNPDPFQMFRVDNEPISGSPSNPISSSPSNPISGSPSNPISGSPSTPEINPVPTEKFDPFANFAIDSPNGPMSSVQQPAAANLIPENNPTPTDPFNPFAVVGLGGPNEASSNVQDLLTNPQNSEVPRSQGSVATAPAANPDLTQSFNAFAEVGLGGHNEPITNTQENVQQNSRVLITPLNNPLPPISNSEPSSNTGLQINPLPSSSNAIITPTESAASSTPFQVSACVEGYIRRNCSENACAGQTCHIPGAKCFESNCGSCRAEWYLDGRLVDCSAACPPKTLTTICTNPCSYMSCPAYPQAVCRSNKCGICRADFFVNNEQVSCDLPSDPCPADQKPKSCVCLSKICPMDSQARCRIVGCGRNCRIQYYKAGVNGIEEVSCGWYSRKRT